MNQSLNQSINNPAFIGSNAKPTHISLFPYPPSHHRRDSLTYTFPSNILLSPRRCCFTAFPILYHITRPALSCLALFIHNPPFTLQDRLQDRLQLRPSPSPCGKHLFNRNLARHENTRIPQTPQSVSVIDLLIIRTVQHGPEVRDAGVMR